VLGEENFGQRGCPPAFDSHEPVAIVGALWVQGLGVFAPKMRQAGFNHCLSCDFIQIDRHPGGLRLGLRDGFDDFRERSAKAQCRKHEAEHESE